MFERHQRPAADPWEKSVSSCSEDTVVPRRSCIVEAEAEKKRRWFGDTRSVQIGHSSVQFESVTVQFSSNRSQFSSVRIGHSSVQFESVTVQFSSSRSRSPRFTSRSLANTTVAGRAAGLPAPLLAATVRTKKAAGGVHDPGFVCGHHVTRESPLCHPSGTRRQLGGLRAYNYVSDGSCGASLAAYVRTTESSMVHVAPTWRPTCSHYVVCRQTGARIDRQSHLNYACYYEVDTVQ